jgi:LacI family transcriptional regulator
MRTKGPTLHEVAKRAGVSIATVSRVARGLDQISNETRSRVQAAIDELNYRPSHFGQALVRRRHGTLGIVFPGISGPYYSEVIHGYEMEAIAAGMSLLILGTEMLPKADTQVLGMADRADGLAIMGGAVGDDLIARLQLRGTPLVTMARQPLPGVPNVRVDNFSSTHALVTHLIANHDLRHLAYVGNVSDSPDGQQRWSGFVQAHEDAGLTPPTAALANAWEQSSGIAAGLHIAAMTDRPDAIVCGSDEIAAGVMYSLAARGIRVPGEIVVTGWDDGPLARYVSPPLTTIHQPARLLGQETARLMLATIQQRSNKGEDKILPTHLVIRASCGCPYDPATEFQSSAEFDHVKEETPDARLVAT